jgi:putative FmdB family regulatory protein
MPLYEYLCSSCSHKFQKLQPMSASGADCPNCEQPARRTLSVFAAHSRGQAGASQPSPLPPMGGGGCCGGGCCGSGH